jgi:hypothetical protein
LDLRERKWREAGEDCIMRRWVGHEARMEKMGNTCNSLVENLKGRDHSEDLAVDRRIILEWILGK